MYSKNRIIISSSFFGAGLRKKKEKHKDFSKQKYCFGENNLYISKHDNESHVQYIWFQNYSPISIMDGLDFHCFNK